MKTRTPGPWFMDTSLHVYGTSAPRQDSHSSTAQIIEHPHVCSAKNFADAALIVAAPDALMALAKIADLKTWNECAQADPQIRLTKADISNMLDSAITIARAALAKAEAGR